MKKTTKIKVMFLSMLMFLGLIAPVKATAQSDGFFRGGYDNYDNRGGINSNTGTGITNDDFDGAPLGSGIAILLGAGLGYVAFKKKEDKQ